MPAFGLADRSCESARLRPALPRVARPAAVLGHITAFQLRGAAVRFCRALFVLAGESAYRRISHAGES